MSKIRISVVSIKTGICVRKGKRIDGQIRMEVGEVSGVHTRRGHLTEEEGGEVTCATVNIASTSRDLSILPLQ